MRQPPAPALVAAYETGTAPTLPASKGVASANWRTLRGRRDRRPISPDREASRGRRRTLGGSSALPDKIRRQSTEGERAALCVVAGEIRRRGICDLAVDAIAALAGICRTTAQNALRKAAALGHASVERRPMRGRRSLTNIIRITCTEWRAWIGRAARLIGFKSLNPTKRKKESGYRGRQEGESNLPLGRVSDRTSEFVDRRGGEKPNKWPADSPIFPFVGRVVAAVMPIVSGVGRVCAFWEFRA